MKFDMHCHTKEGSVDAKVSVSEYAKILLLQGFDGMLITDHNSYRGYEKWKQLVPTLSLDRPFTVLKGIEYDTRDGGHILAILPDGVSSRLLRTRGLSVFALERIVHSLGGILGPAHPFGTGFFAYMNTRLSKRKKELLSRFDFIETFNACTPPHSNRMARNLAEHLHKPHLAGSDAHRPSVIGSAFTLFDDSIRTNNDLIRAVTQGQGTRVSFPDQQNMHRFKGQFRKIAGVIAYGLYNQTGALLYLPVRLYYSLIELHLKKSGVSE